MKICNRCKVEKLLSEYWRNKGTKDGYLNICKNCYKSSLNPENEKKRNLEYYHKIRKYRPKIKQYYNKEQYLKYKAKHPEYRNAEYWRNWRMEHDRKEYQKQQRIKNPTKASRWPSRVLNRA